MFYVSVPSGNTLENVSNKFRGENQNTEMIFFLDLG